VAGRVVELLEAVQVEQRDGQRRADAARAAHLAAQLVLEGAAVGQPGQGVGARRALELRALDDERGVRGQQREHRAGVVTRAGHVGVPAHGEEADRPPAEDHRLEVDVQRAAGGEHRALDRAEEAVARARPAVAQLPAHGLGQPQAALARGGAGELAGDEVAAGVELPDLRGVRPGDPARGLAHRRALLAVAGGRDGGLAHALPRLGRVALRRGAAGAPEDPHHQPGQGGQADQEQRHGQGTTRRERRDEHGDRGLHGLLGSCGEPRWVVELVEATLSRPGACGRGAPAEAPLGARAYLIYVWHPRFVRLTASFGVLPRSRGQTEGGQTMEWMDHAGQSDAQLTIAASRGDDDAFAELYGRYAPRIRTYLARLLDDEHLAQDLTHEVFVSALRRLRTDRPPIAVGPWLYRIARNASIDVHRRSQVVRQVPLDDGAEQATSSGARQAGPEESAEVRQWLEHLRYLLDGLSESHRTVLVLRELEGLSNGEIAERLGISRPAVEGLLFRARTKVRREYDDLVTGRRCDNVRASLHRAGSD
jgi:RNA polymerase sigma factor (sigma-70 family)